LRARYLHESVGDRPLDKLRAIDDCAIVESEQPT
jgi:hypothetical protein